AVARQPTGDLGLQRRVGNLVIGRIEFGLIQVQPYMRTFVVSRRPDETTRCRRLSQRRPRCKDRGCAERRTSCDWSDQGLEIEMHALDLDLGPELDDLSRRHVEK